MTTNGVFCLEGEWDDDLRRRRSVLPILDLLERLGEIKYIHRDVGTIGEVERYLSKWDNEEYNDYQVLYLATHGDREQIYWSNDGRTQSSSSLSEVAAALQGVAATCYVHLGGCQALFEESVLTEFVELTGVAGVFGYRKDVEWIDAAAFEVLLLPMLANFEGRPKTLFNTVMRRYGQLAANLRFVVGTGSEVLRAEHSLERS